MPVCFSEKILVFFSVVTVCVIVYCLYKLKSYMYPKFVIVKQPETNVNIKTSTSQDYNSNRFPVRNGDNGGLVGYIQSSTKNYPLYLTRNRNKRKFFYHVNYSSDDNRILLPIKVSNNDSEELYDSQEIFINELSDNFRVVLYKDTYDV